MSDTVDNVMDAVNESEPADVVVNEEARSLVSEEAEPAEEAPVASEAAEPAVEEPEPVVEEPLL